MNHDIIRTESGDELVILSRRDFDALLAAAGDEAAEGRAAERIVLEMRAALARGEETLLPEWLAVPTAEGEPATAVVRRHLGRTQAEVAKAAGVRRGFLADVERGAKRLTPRTRARLAAALGVEAAWLEEA